MLVTSIFSFACNVFYSIKDRNHHFSNIQFAPTNAFNVVKARNFEILDLVQFKAFADDISNTAQMVICLFGRNDNVVGKGENAGYQCFLLWSHCFLNIFFHGL